MVPNLHLHPFCRSHIQCLFLISGFPSSLHLFVLDEHDNNKTDSKLLHSKTKKEKKFNFIQLIQKQFQLFIQHNIRSWKCFSCLCDASVILYSSMKPHGTFSNTTMCCIKGVLCHRPVTPRCDSRADHQLLYLSGSKWAYLLMPSIPGAGLWRPSDGLALLQPSHPLCTCEPSSHQPALLPRQRDMPRDNICHPLVTCWVKPTTESRARSKRSRFYHNKDLSTTVWM